MLKSNKKNKRILNKEIKKRKAEYLIYCESKEYYEQYENIRKCVKKALDEWINNEKFSKRYPDYQLIAFDDICIFLSNDISYIILNDNSLDITVIQQSLWHECIDACLDTYETFDDDFSLNKLSKVAEKVLKNLAEDLPEEERFAVPFHLRNLY